MFKHLPAFLAAIALLVIPTGFSNSTMAGTKFQRTGKSIQSGQSITLQITNQTSEPVQVEIPSYTAPISISPKQKRKFNFQIRQKDHGLSVLYWTPEAKPLQAKVSKPNAKTLHVNISSGGFPDDDRAIYDSEFTDTLFIF